VDEITGIAPAMRSSRKIDPQTPGRPSRTATEIYDYLRLLYARAGRTY